MSVASKPYHLPGHVVLDEPKLRFGSRDARDVDAHPLQGLLQFGPYSRDKISVVSNPIRIATIVPAGDSGRLTKQVRELEQVHRPHERRVYLPAYPGFEKVFSVRLARGGPGTAIELPSDLSTRIDASPTPHLELGEALTQALFALRNLRSSFDVVLVLLRQEWEAGFRGPPGDDFDKISVVSNPIRIATIVPAGDSGRLTKQVRE